MNLPMATARASDPVMMKMTFNIVSAMLTFGLVAGCASDKDSGGSEITEAEARSKASAAAPAATISSVTKLDEGTEHRWKIEVTMPNGAPLTIELERTTGAVAEIAGEKGPFDYELPAPAAGFMTYSQAKGKALAAKTGGVELWEVKPEKQEYEFYVRETATSRLWEIKMEATRGDITTMEEKDKPD